LCRLSKIEIFSCRNEVKPLPVSLCALKANKLLRRFRVRTDKRTQRVQIIKRTKNKMSEKKDEEHAKKYREKKNNPQKSTAKA